MYEPLDAYQSVEDFPQLAVDIQRFLERPQPINDLFSEEEIRRLMFDLTATEITGKIMNLNAYNFISRHINSLDK
jgi:hypothetical protein